MWTIRWSENIVVLKSAKDTMKLINNIHCDHLNVQPIIVQVESSLGDLMLIGVGNESYSIIDYFPHNKNYSLSPQGENDGNDIVSFYIGDDESQFYTKDTIKYQTALEILEYFLTTDALLEKISWVYD